MLRKFLFFIALPILLMTACHSNSSENEATRKNDSVSLAKNVFTDQMGGRFFLTGDFDGNGIKDTLFESYISLISKQESYKHYYFEETDKDNKKIISMHPLCRLYSHQSAIDSLLISNQYDQSGIFLIENLGNITGDAGDEIGFIIDNADLSLVNTYFIYTYSNHQWKLLYRFPINEMKSFDDENLINDTFLVRKAGPNTIVYKYVNDNDIIADGRKVLE